MIHLTKKKDIFITNFLLGFLSKSYNFENYKTDNKNKKDNRIQKHLIYTSNKNNISKCLKDAQAINLGLSETRNLVTTPANILNPFNFSKKIVQLKKFGLKVEIIDENKLNKLGMRALLGVGQGSANKSYVAVMSWNGLKNKNKKSFSFYWKRSLF